MRYDRGADRVPGGVEVQCPLTTAAEIQVVILKATEVCCDDLAGESLALSRVVLSYSSQHLTLGLRHYMTLPRCSMTGVEIQPGDGVWDDGEWISWEWINSELEGEPEDDALSHESIEPYQSRDGFPFSVLEQAEIFHDLVDCAARHFENTGRYLQVWGELGEIYAEIKLGLRRHGTHKAGSDGTIAGKLVEVKTISPEKTSDRVLVKSQGDFEQLLIVRISKDFEFQGKLFDRSELRGIAGKFLRGQLKDDASNAQ